MLKCDTAKQVFDLPCGNANNNYKHASPGSTFLHQLCHLYDVIYAFPHLMNLVVGSTGWRGGFMAFWYFRAN